MAKLTKEWLKQIKEAQLETDYTINGQSYPRYKMGDEGRYNEGDTCHDCGITYGQYHVPGCDVEVCPKCQGQAISCDCREED